MAIKQQLDYLNKMSSVSVIWLRIWLFCYFSRTDIKVHQFTSEVSVRDPWHHSIQITLGEPWAYWAHLQEPRWHVATAWVTQESCYHTSHGSMGDHKGNINSTRKLLCTLAAPQPDAARAESYVVKWMGPGKPLASLSDDFIIKALST